MIARGLPLFAGAINATLPKREAIINEQSRSRYLVVVGVARSRTAARRHNVGLCVTLGSVKVVDGRPPEPSAWIWQCRGIDRVAETVRSDSTRAGRNTNRDVRFQGRRMLQQLAEGCGSVEPDDCSQI